MLGIAISTYFICHSDRDAFIYVYLPLVKKEVDDYIVDWNVHKIRYQRAVRLPSGACPDDIYYLPDRFGEKSGYYTDF